MRGSLYLKILSAFAFSRAVIKDSGSWLDDFSLFILILSISCASEFTEFTFELFHTICAFMTF